MLSLQNKIAINSSGGAGGLSSIITTYGFLNAWSSENVNISGTDTTLVDYLGEHDLVNPAAANQPSYTASDSDFNNKPSLTYDGTTDYSYKAVANYRGSDTGGVIIGVCKVNGGIGVTFLSVSDEAANNEFSWQKITTNMYQYSIKNSGVVNSILGSTTNINDSSAHVLSTRSNASSYKMTVDSTNEAFSVAGGVDNGKWLSGNTVADNLVIGALVQTVTTYSSMDWVFTGYMPFTDDAAILAATAELKTYYGI